jgi:hypothetical protein
MKIRGISNLRMQLDFGISIDKKEGTTIEIQRRSKDQAANLAHDKKVLDWGDKWQRVHLGGMWRAREEEKTIVGGRGGWWGRMGAHGLREEMKRYKSGFQVAEKPRKRNDEKRLKRRNGRWGRKKEELHFPKQQWWWELKTRSGIEVN